MRVAITGSTGLVGTALQSRLRELGHEVVPVTRGDLSDPGVLWNPPMQAIRDGAFDDVDAVINLSGASIGDGRWTEKRKQLLRTSRIDLTDFLVAHLSRLENGPSVLVNASAVGYYGTPGDELLTEASPRGDDFAASLVGDWEDSAIRARDHGMRVAIVRSGIVLSAEGGALKKMLLPFKLGLGGRLGSGRQYFSWVSLPDIVEIYVHALTSDIDGVLNGTAPAPVTNAEYTKALGAALGRPTIFPVPGFAMKLLFGSELAESLLLNGQRVLPARLQTDGFEFKRPTVQEALNAIFKTKEDRQ